jgi:uncharacterized protein
LTPSVNVYKVLLTRGLIGCVIYSTDAETRAFLAELGIPAAEGAHVEATPSPA